MLLRITCIGNILPRWFDVFTRPTKEAPYEHCGNGGGIQHRKEGGIGFLFEGSAAKYETINETTARVTVYIPVSIKHLLGNSWDCKLGELAQRIIFMCCTGVKAEICHFSMEAIPDWDTPKDALAAACIRLTRHCEHWYIRSGRFRGESTVTVGNEDEISIYLSSHVGHTRVSTGPERPRVQVATQEKPPLTDFYLSRDHARQFPS